EGRDRGVGGDLALGDELTGHGHPALVVGISGGPDGGARRGDGQQGQGRQGGRDQAAAPSGAARGPGGGPGRGGPGRARGGGGAAEVALPAAFAVLDGGQGGAPVEHVGVAILLGPQAGVLDEPVIDALGGEVGFDPLPEPGPGGEQRVVGDLGGVLVQREQ